MLCLLSWLVLCSHTDMALADRCCSLLHTGIKPTEKDHVTMKSNENLHVPRLSLVYEFTFVWGLVEHHHPQFHP